MPGTENVWKNEKFCYSLYDYDYSGVNDEGSSDEEEAAIYWNWSVQTSHSRCGWSVTLTIVVKKKKPPRWI